MGFAFQLNDEQRAGRPNTRKKNNKKTPAAAGVGRCVSQSLTLQSYQHCCLLWLFDSLCVMAQVHDSSQPPVTDSCGDAIRPYYQLAGFSKMWGSIWVGRCLWGVTLLVRVFLFSHFVVSGKNNHLKCFSLETSNTNDFVLWLSREVFFFLFLFPQSSSFTPLMTNVGHKQNEFQMKIRWKLFSPTNNLGSPVSLGEVLYSRQYYSFI